MSGLRILITNTALDARAGSELYVRDIAIALLRRGHTPVVYSPVLGEVARELRAKTVPVVDDLAGVGAAPDVIHAQHHLEAMTALASFPRTPAVFVCHGWKPWEETPPRHPRIRRYVAVDETCRDRVVLENGIAESRVRVLLNFVDLERFPARDPLPATPRRALVFSNAARPGSYAEVLRAACERAGLTLDCLGNGMGNAQEDPGALLAHYDVVFAKARAAIEALAVGNAVVLCDAVGLGPLVTSAELDRLRPLNFGVRTLSAPIEAALVSERLARYDATDAAIVSSRMRAAAGLEGIVDELVALYREVIDEHRDARAGSIDEELRATAAYLREISQTVKGRAARAIEQAGQRGAAEATAACGREAGTLREEIEVLRRSLEASRDALGRRDRELQALEASRELRVLRRCRGMLDRVLPPSSARRRAFSRVLAPFLPRQGSASS